MTDTNAETPTSVADQIDSGIRQLTGGTNNAYARYLTSVTFSAVSNTYGTFNTTGIPYYYNYTNTGSSYHLSSATFTPNTTATNGGTVTIGFTAQTAYVNGNGAGASISGTLTINIKQYTGNDIIFTGSVGETIDIDEQEFYDFWSELQNVTGNLTTIRFGSTGTGYNSTYGLKYNGGTTPVSVTSAMTFYTSSYNGSTNNANYKPLGNLTYVPNKTGTQYKPGQVTIPFTATGYTSYNYGTGYNTTSVSGTIRILYTDGQVQSIDYAMNNYMVSLKRDDFDAVYRQAMNVSYNQKPTYQIEFLDLPVFGTLYVNSGTNYATGTKLSKQNLGQKYNATSIDKMSYVPGNFGAGETIRYAVYSGSSLKYIGEINFGSTGLEINYVSDSKGVKFSSGDFYNGNGAMLNGYISFEPTLSGTLYKNYANGKGTPVSSYDKFYYTTSAGVESLDSLTFVPYDGFYGVAELTFTSSSYSGGMVRGTVKISVGKEFKDVAKTYWAHDYIARLSAAKIIDGQTATTFAPTSKVKYGEALKMILEAAGYPKQDEVTSGKHWATNYLNLAYRNNIVNTTSIDLNQYITRDEMATIAAKALGLSRANSVIGWRQPVDTSNGYVYALYNASIITGNDAADGYNYFKGQDTLSRAELAKIVCYMMDYKAK